MHCTLIASKFCWLYEQGKITFDVSVARAEQEGMPVTILLLMRETRSSMGNIITPSGSRGRGRRMGRGVVGGENGDDKGDGMKDGNVNGKVDSSSASVKRKLAVTTNKTWGGVRGRCLAFAEARGTLLRLAQINVVSNFSCQAPADGKIFSGEKEEVVMCEISGKMSGAPVPREEGWETRVVMH